LEHSLSQVKQLGRVIESVYKQRLTMLEEHLHYLRLQSSSKKVIRKLKTLDQIPRVILLNLFIKLEIYLNM